MFRWIRTGVATMAAPVAARHSLTRPLAFAAHAMAISSRQLSSPSTPLQNDTGMVDFRKRGSFNSFAACKESFWHQKDKSRIVILYNKSRAAIEDDIREFFEESNYPVEDILMFYDPQTGWSSSVVSVVLRDAATTNSAIKDLNGAILFDHKVELMTVDSYIEGALNSSKREFQRDFMEFAFGWLATDDTRFAAVSLREPPTRPIQDGVYLRYTCFHIKF
jgi:hypothetical protein